MEGVSEIDSPSKLSCQLAGDSGVAILAAQPHAHRWTTVRKRTDTYKTPSVRVLGTYSTNSWVMRSRLTRAAPH